MKNILSIIFIIIGTLLLTGLTNDWLPAEHYHGMVGFLVVLTVIVINRKRILKK